jgi:ribosomal protein S18 acetylase RimI-like enzyme
MERGGGKMRLAAWGDCYTENVITLWNRAAVGDGYKELDADSFSRIFTGSSYFDPLAAFVGLAEQEVVGFACGCTGDDLPLGDRAGYITCIVLDSRYASEEHYKQLLDALEECFAGLGKTQAEVLFFNPMQLPWYIPDTPAHEHNNAPGVPSGSPLHRFLLAQGYTERATEQAMYLELSGFTIPEDILAKEAEAAGKGYSVRIYASGRIDGLDAMLESLGNPLWTKEIGRCAVEGTPVVYALKDGHAAGFAGPVLREVSGRGYFAGIGVHPGHEGHGLGTLLFFRLCEAFQSIGTVYMSLYTGSTNPAARIYEKAGFRTVKTFAIMRKELANE